MTDKEILKKAKQWDLDNPDPRADEFRDCGVRPVPCDIYKIHRISAASELQGNYIGRSVRLRERWRNHLKMKGDLDKVLYRAFVKHGIENWDYCPLVRKWIYPDLALVKRSLKFAKKELYERTQEWLRPQEVRLGDEWKARTKDGGYSVRLGEESGYHFSEFYPKEVVRKYCIENKLTQSLYRDLSRQGKLPEGFPCDPPQTYGEPWSYFTGNTSNQDKKFYPKEVVRKYCIENKLTRGSYRDLFKRGELPEGFPGDPFVTYGEPWSYFTGNTRDKKFYPKEVVRKYCIENKLTQVSYRDLFKQGKLPEGFPSNPSDTYGELWSYFSGNAKQEAKPVRCKETGTVYASQEECAQAMGLRQSKINQVLHGERKHTGGYTFESVDK
jgi:hypothetical protein